MPMIPKFIVNISHGHKVTFVWATIIISADNLSQLFSNQHTVIILKESYSDATLLL